VSIYTNHRISTTGQPPANVCALLLPALSTFATSATGTSPVTPPVANTVELEVGTLYLAVLLTFGVLVVNGPVGGALSIEAMIRFTWQIASYYELRERTALISIKI